MDDCGMKCSQPFGIATLTKELVACLKTLHTSSGCKYKHQYESVVKLSKYYLSYSINRIKEEYMENVETLASKRDLKREIFQKEVEAEQMQVKVSHIRQEWLKQQHTLAELQDCYYQKCRVLSTHSNYYSTQGGALCSLILLLLDEANALQVFLEEKNFFLSFVKVAYEFLYSFVGTYSADPPIEDSPDSKFVMSLYACLAKVSWNVQGRIAIIEQEEGQNFVWHLVHVVGRIKHNCLENLKLLAWIILRNISRDEDGTVLMQGCNTLLIRLSNVLKEDYQPKLFNYALEIVERLSRNIPNKEYLKEFEVNIKVQMLTQLSGVAFKDVGSRPSRILANIGRAAQTFLRQSDDVTSVKFNPKVLRVCTLSQHRVEKEKTDFFEESVSLSTSSASTKLSDKGVQVCPASVKHKHKKMSNIHKKRKKVFSKPFSAQASFIIASPPIFPVSSGWTRKKAAIPSSIAPSSPAVVSNRRSTDFPEKISTVSVDLDSLHTGDFVEKEIEPVTLLSDNYSQMDDELTLGEKTEDVPKESLSENRLMRWSPIKTTISYLSKQDSVVVPAAKIINRVVRGALNKSQKIVNRIKIPKSYLQNES